MFNPISFVNYASVTTAVTMGIAPGNQAPAQLLVVNPTANATITLPPSDSSTVAPPTVQQSIVGPGGGYRLTLYNSSTWTISLATQGADTIIGTPQSLVGPNTRLCLQVAPAVSAWFVVSN